MNERDSAQVATMLGGRGFRLVDSEEQADVILPNTCKRARYGGTESPWQNGHVDPSAPPAPPQHPHLVLGFLGCMAQS